MTNSYKIRPVLSLNARNQQYGLTYERHVPRCSRPIGSNGNKKPICNKPNPKSAPLKLNYSRNQTDDPKKIEGGIASNNKEFNELSKQIDHGIIINQRTNKIYSITGDIKTVVGGIKPGQKPTDDVFGNNIDVVTPLTSGNKTPINNNVIRNNPKINNSLGEGSGINIKRLLKRVESLETTVKTLRETISTLKTKKGPQGPPGPAGSDGPEGQLGPKGDKGEPGSADTDVITGLNNRVKGLESAVDLSSLFHPDAGGIGPLIYRNKEDIKSNHSQNAVQFDSINKRLTSVEGNLAGPSISSHENFDVISKINGLTQKLSAVEQLLYSIV